MDATAYWTVAPGRGELRREQLATPGRDEVLVRTLASMRTYYAKWAKNWEFQALLKARPMAGDLALGAAS